MTLYLMVLLAPVAAAVALLSGSVIGSPAVRGAVRRARTMGEVSAIVAVGRPLLRARLGPWAVPSGGRRQTA
jgi:predicted N-acetyltransferase YhbS